MEESKYLRALSAGNSRRKSSSLSSSPSRSLSHTHGRLRDDWMERVYKRIGMSGILKKPSFVKGAIKKEREQTIGTNKKELKRK